MWAGPFPTFIVLMGILHDVRIAVTVNESKLATYAVSPRGVTVMSSGSFPVLIVVSGLLVFNWIGVTSSDPVLTTYALIRLSCLLQWASMLTFREDSNGLVVNRGINMLIPATGASMSIEYRFWNPPIGLPAFSQMLMVRRMSLICCRCIRIAIRVFPFLS